MSYVEAITTAIIAFPFIAFLFTIPFILYNYHQYGSIHFLKVFIIYTFILYLITIYFLVIFPLPSFEEVMNNTGPYINYIPFKFVSDFIHETPFVWNNPETYMKAILDPSFYVVIFNVLMFVPLGMYLRYYFKCSFKKTILYALLLSLFFELTQLTGLYFIYPNPYRLCDIDDLIENIFGGILGFLIMGPLDNFLPAREEIDEEAIKMGQKVSGLRRITVYFLDLILFLLLSLLVSIIINRFVLIIGFLIYYVFIPIINHKATLGMKFLNLKMEYKKHWIISNIFRYLFLFFYYFILPLGFLLFVLFIRNYWQLQSITFMIFGLALFIIFLFYLLHMILLLKLRKGFYDRFFGFKFISTINFKKEI